MLAVISSLPALANPQCDDFLKDARDHFNAKRYFDAFDLLLIFNSDCNANEDSNTLLAKSEAYLRIEDLKNQVAALDPLSSPARYLTPKLIDEIADLEKRFQDASYKTYNPIKDVIDRSSIQNAIDDLKRQATSVQAQIDGQVRNEFATEVVKTSVSSLRAYRMFRKA